ncbi:MAG: DUF177 domain-containing protein [Oscillospiraceae bacterium]|jgi:uncharacterized protein|nr:DUF177 domain-containing protein [Oscillospiraceae bacterium]
MILNLRKIFAEGQETYPFEYEFDLSQTQVGGFYPFVSPVKVKGAVSGKEGFARLKIRSSFDFSIPCDRCAAQIDRHYEYAFSHILVPSSENKGDDRYIEVRDQQLNVDELVREDILLELPTRFLCREDCKGVCPECGKNLNDGPCGCSAQKIDPRLEVLKNLLH